MTKQHRSLGWGLWLLAAAVVVALVVEPVLAHGRGGGTRRTAVVPRISLPFYSGWAMPFFSPSFSTYYGYPYRGPYRPVRGGLSPALARALEVGALDLDVKPRHTDVFVDGVYVGLATDFDGRPSYLWLDKGAHTVVLLKDSFVGYQAVFEIEPGVVTGVKVRLREGSSEGRSLGKGLQGEGAWLQGDPSI